MATTYIAKYTERLQRAVDTALSRNFHYVTSSSRVKGVNTFTERKGSGFSSGGETYEYIGYFKLILESQPVSDEPGANVDYYVNIVDGATYDPAQTPVSGKSVCKVNNVTFSLDPYQSGEITETSIFALRYTAPIDADEDDGSEEQDEKVEIVNLTAEGYSSLPSDTSKICYYQLGRAIVTTDTEGNKSVTIQQDHQATASNGIPQIFRYALCGE